MDHIHVTAVINRAAQLQQADGWQHAAAAVPGRLGDGPANITVPSSNSGDSSSSSNSVEPPPVDLTTLRAVTQPLLLQHLHHMQGRQAVTSLHSCTRLGWLKPTSRLTRQLLNQCALHMEELTPQGLSLAVHACALLGVTPGPGWVAAWCGTLQQQLRRLKPQDVAVMVWSVGRLRLPLRHPKLWPQLLLRSGVSVV
jgi:hypothetical protein